VVEGDEARFLRSGIPVTVTLTMFEPVQVCSVIDIVVPPELPRRQENYYLYFCLTCKKLVTSGVV
jgi:hypothetical protein